MRNYYTLINSMGSGAAAIDADAQAFITAAAITDSTQQSAINTLVTDLKGYGIWTKMKALYPFVGGTASTHKWNLKDPRDLDAAYRLVFSGGWTHSSTGALPNGTTGYADTYLTPSLSLSQNNKHLSVYFKNASNIINNTLIGAGNGSTFDHLIFTNSAFFGNLSSNFAFNYIVPNNGLYVTRRISSTGTETFRNNSLFFADNQTSNGNTNVSYSIGRRNYNGGDFYGNNTISFTSIGDGLTDAEASNFYKAVQAYQTTLGRQV